MNNTKLAGSQLLITKFKKTARWALCCHNWLSFVNTPWSSICPWVKEEDRKRVTYYETFITFVTWEILPFHGQRNRLLPWTKYSAGFLHPYKALRVKPGGWCCECLKLLSVTDILKKDNVNERIVIKKKAQIKASVLRNHCCLPPKDWRASSKVVEACRVE